jgi:hypothetical protein
MKKSITREIEYCARCGEDHRRIVFQKFLGKPISAEGFDFQYWGWCPTYLEPIIFHLGEDDEEFADSRTSKEEAKECKHRPICGCSPECKDPQSCTDEAEPLPET